MTYKITRFFNDENVLEDIRKELSESLKADFHYVKLLEDDGIYVEFEFEIEEDLNWFSTNVNRR